MCGGHADEPVASYAVGDVVRLTTKRIAGRVGRIGRTDKVWGLRVDFPGETEDEPVWVKWDVFTDLLSWGETSLVLVDEGLFREERTGDAYVDFGDGWLERPVIMKKRRRCEASEGKNASGREARRRTDAAGPTPPLDETAGPPPRTKLA
mmetsp:Transcript_28668/g.85885  ORF Transcript_28668/g.85885 Transcript_28668/m.85885 type:complete len:150 (+) Transcript_28668:133-582(+)